MTTPTTRPRRSSSLGQYLRDAENSSDHHISHLAAIDAGAPDADASSPSAPRLHLSIPQPPPASSTPRPPKTLKRRQSSSHSSSSDEPATLLSWVKRPSEAFTILTFLVAAYLAWRVAFPNAKENPFEAFWKVSYRLGPEAGELEGRYRKGPRDFQFVTFWVVVFSFLRQTITERIRLLAKRWGVKGERKLQRFMEQGYTALYFSITCSFGLYIMGQQSTWFYHTPEFWLGYKEAWALPGNVKAYYLIASSYWFQQALVMLARLEKPRDDYYELVAHHIVTVFLVSTSYIANMTAIGLCVFVSMDIPDLFLSISKCINYLGQELIGNCSFVIFLGTWLYFRIYQNIRMLWSVWFEFELIPIEARVIDPKMGWWMAPFVRYIIFIPIFALLILNLFWTWLIFRVLYRLLTAGAASDVREEGEGETDVSESEGGRSRSGSVVEGKKDK